MIPMWAECFTLMKSLTDQKKYYPSWWLQEIELPSEKDIKIKNMQKEFVPYELAVKLKELGFDGVFFGMYTEDRDFPHLVYGDLLYSKVNMYLLKEECFAPLWQQAFDWFRLEMSIDSWIQKTYDCYNISIVRMDDDFEGNEDLTDGLSFKDFKIYEQARQACLEKLIQILENENKTNTN